MYFGKKNLYKQSKYIKRLFFGYTVILCGVAVKYLYKPAKVTKPNIIIMFGAGLIKGSNEN